jgi:spore maturation protein CgeB
MFSIGMVRWSRVSRNSSNRIPVQASRKFMKALVRSKEIDGIMNQVSPRVFEAIAARTVLVLFEGNYSGVVKAGEHFIPLKKDGSNLAEVVSLLQDGAYVDAMAERAYRDVIASGKYSYKSFVDLVDMEKWSVRFAGWGSRMKSRLESVVPPATRITPRRLRLGRFERSRHNL